MAKTKADLVIENEALRNDLLIIATRIKEEAINRSWCEDYDRVMDEVNDQTSEPHMQPCITEHTVTVEGTVLISFSDLQTTVETEGDEPTTEEMQDAVRAFLNNEVGIHSGMHYVIDGVRSVDITSTGSR